MFQDLYFVSCDCIRCEVEHLFSTEEKFRGIKPVFFSFDLFHSQNTDNIVSTIEELNCDNDILVLCERPCHEKLATPDEYEGTLSIHGVENLHDLFATKSFLQKNIDSNTFIALPGWLESWHERAEANKIEKSSFYADNYSCILVLDTGLHSDTVLRVQQFAEFADLPFRIVDVGLEHFSLALENIVLHRNLEKKQGQLKLSQRKTASYAMSLDFIRTMADMTNEPEAIDSVCNLFETLFAPKDIFYIPFDKSKPCGSQCSSLPRDTEALDSFKSSNAEYVAFDSEDGFAVKISSKDEVLGIVEVDGISFPEYIDEYLSIALDLAKASGLAISNIRRYHEIFKSREEQVKLTDMLRTTNRILRHDIANDLQVMTVSLDLLEDKYDEKFVKMSQKAVQRSIALIRSMSDLDYALSPGNQLELQSVKNVVASVTERYDADFHLEGDCLVMIDPAFFSVIDNIVSNALVHGNASRLDISTGLQDDFCKISISDNGTGIPDDVKPHVFDEGFKYGKTGHTGIGLYIAKKTIERYEGKIKVEDNESGGAKFVIELPIRLIGES